MAEYKINHIWCLILYSINCLQSQARILYSVVHYYVSTYILKWFKRKRKRILKEKGFFSLIGNININRIHNTTMNDNLYDIVSEVNRLLPQLAEFITQFKALVADTGINVVSDAHGNMSIDVPMKMSDIEANNVSTRIGIIDRLITQNGTTINSLFQKGLAIEESLKKTDPSYNSQFIEHIARFKELNRSYNH